jgi:hypothetical protein
MSFVELDARIRDWEQRISKLQGTMELARKEFVGAAVPHLQNWVENHAAHCVSTQLTHTASLNDERLSEMRRKVRELRDQLPELAEPLLTDDAIWDGSAQWEVSGVKPVPVEIALRRAAGYLGPILEEYGYIKKDDWAMRDASRRPLPTQCVPYHNFEWSPGMTDRMVYYNGLIDKHQEAVEKRADLNRQKAEFAAAERWKKA